MTTQEEYEHRTQTEKRICVSLAGRIGERLAASSARNRGWLSVIHRNSEAATCWHEASHLTLAAVYEWHIEAAHVVPSDEPVQVGRGTYATTLGGVVSWPSSQQLQHFAPRHGRAALSDQRSAAQFAYLIAPELTWKSTLRLLRQLSTRTEALLLENWTLVSAFAAGLADRKSLTAEEIQSVIERVELQENFPEVAGNGSAISRSIPENFPGLTQGLPDEAVA